MSNESELHRLILDPFRSYLLDNKKIYIYEQVFMVLSSLTFQFLWFYFVFGQYGRAEWPSSNSSNIHLLGLFINTSKFAIENNQFHAMFQSAIILSQQYNITIDGQYIGGQSVETQGDVMIALRNTCSRVSTLNIVGIVGPSISSESHSIARFAVKIGIPVISYGATDPELSDRNSYSTFYRTVPSDNAAAMALVDLFIRYNWTSCIIIYQNDAFGSGGVKAVSEAFNKNKLNVEKTIVFDVSTSTIRGDLKQLLEKSFTRIVLLWAIPDYTLSILECALNNSVIGSQFTWILSSNIPLDSFDKKFHDELIGMLIIAPVVENAVHTPVNETLLKAAHAIWERYEPETYPGVDNVSYYALFAFDAAWTLIQALQEICSLNTNHSSSCLSFINTSFCFDRQLLNSTSLLSIINTNTFLGVSGHVQFSTNTTDRIHGSHYILKNVQHSSNVLNSVPVLLWSESDNWTSYKQSNNIFWPGNRCSPAPTGRAELSGIELQIGVYESRPFTMLREPLHGSGQINRTLIGYVPDLIDLLSQRMGFIPKLILIPSTVSYDGLIDAVANSEYHMIVADITITASRRNKVAFSSSFFHSSLGLIIREESIDDVDLLAYLRPFSFELWLTIFVTDIYAGFLIYLLEREHNERLRDQSTFLTIIKSMWYIIGTVLAYGSDFSVRTTAGRLLTVGLYILSLVSIAVYTAKLTSDLTIAKTRGSISGIQDIKNGKVAFNRIGLVAHTSIEEYYLREISPGSPNFHPLNDDNEAYERLINNTIDAAIMDSNFAAYVINNFYCSLTLVGKDFDKNVFGIVFRKDWLHHQSFDQNILSLGELGELEKLKRKWFEKNSCSRPSTKSSAVTIKSMAGLFLTFGVISLLSLLLFLWPKRFAIKDFLLKLIHRKNVSRIHIVSKHSQVEGEDRLP